MPNRYTSPYTEYDKLFEPYTDDQERLQDLLAQMNYPEIVQAGSEQDYGQRFKWGKYGLGNLYQRNHTMPNGTEYTAEDNAHFLIIPFMRPQIGYEPNTLKAPSAQQRTTYEEFPHAYLFNNGMQNYAESLQDFLVSGREQDYLNPFTMEGFTHGLFSDNTINAKEKQKRFKITKKLTKDLGLENLLVDFNGDKQKDYVIPGFNNDHGPVGGQYWVEAYRRGKINQETLDKALKIVSDYHQNGRKDAYYDAAWKANKQNYAEQLRKLGFTDGGDLIRFATPTLSIINFVGESGNIISTKRELAKKEKELEKAYKNKEITKDQYNKIKKQYELANKSLHKKIHATIGNDFSNAVKETKQGNLKQAAKSAGKGLLKVADSSAGAGQSASNIMQNFIANQLTQETKKAIKKGVYDATDYVMDKSPQWLKNANKKANPYAKKAITSTWNWIPEGSFKDALRDNKLMRFGRDWAKRYGLWKKNGGVLNIQDMLIY